MKKILLIILICIQINTRAKAQDQILIPLADTIWVDGQMSVDEWSGSDSVEINFLSTKKVKIYFKHDGENLLLCYKGNLESANVRFPEVLLDINFDRSLDFLSDDWWFHVSTTDCEYKGAYGNYASCATSKVTWQANNILQGLPLTDLVEIKIPFRTVGIDLSRNDTIGISFLVSNTFNAFNHWPISASRFIPGSWGIGILEKFSTDINTLRTDELIVYPNPVNDLLNIKTNQINLLEYFIYNSIGELVVTGKIKENKINIDELKNGVYLLRLMNINNEFLSKKIIKN